MRLIDADALLMHLNDWAFAEAPDERTPNSVREYTAYDIQRMIYRTINDAMTAVDDEITVDWKQNLTTKLHQLEMFNEDIPNWVWKVIEGM